MVSVKCTYMTLEVSILIGPVDDAKSPKHCLLVEGL